MSAFRSVNPGVELWGRESHVPRHRHDHPYAALILSGSYQECGSLGRYRVRAGHVLLHRSFDAHLDHFGAAGARILNLPLDAEPSCTLGSVGDPDAIMRLAEQDIPGATLAVSEQLRPLRPQIGDWPDLLAQDLLHDPQLRLTDWACAHGLAPETLSRGFGKAFGLSPARYRLEARTHRALDLIGNGMPLAAVAFSAGFADQAHMTRAITALTGRSPARWLGSNRFKKRLAPPAQNGACNPILPPTP